MLDSDAVQGREDGRQNPQGHDDALPEVRRVTPKRKGRYLQTRRYRLFQLVLFNTSNSTTMLSIRIPGQAAIPQRKNKYSSPILFKRKGIAYHEPAELFHIHWN